MIRDKIRYFREKERYTQQELAEKLFLSDRAIGHYETGKRTPSIDTLKDISKCLKVELDEFFKDETKRLMQLQYTYREFRNMLFSFADQQANDNLEPKHFMMYMESDRYFIQLNREFMGSPMTYLVWLLDGFYLIPLKTEWWDGAYDTILDVFDIKKVSKADVDYIQKACGRTYIKSQNERSFAESIYKSMFDTMDFTIDNSTPEDDLLSFMVYETEGLFAFDYEKECFYAKNKDGIFKVDYFEGEYNNEGFLVVDFFYLDDRTQLRNEEIDALHEYVSLKDKEAKLLLNEFENTETLDARKTAGE